MLVVAVLLATVVVVFFNTATASADWLPEGWATEGTVYKNTTNGDIEFWSKGAYVTKLTPSEFEQYSKIVEAYGKSINDPSMTASTISQDAINSTSGLTQVESEDVASIVLKARADGTTITAGPLSSVESTAGMDLAANDVGAWGSAGLAGGSAAAFGALTLGPLAFLAGVDIGNEVDQLFGLPGLELGEEEHPKPPEGLILKWEPGVYNPRTNKLLPGSVSGMYATPSWSTGVDGEVYENLETHVITGGYFTTFEQSNMSDISEGRYGGEGGPLYKYTVYAYLVCAKASYYEYVGECPPKPAPPAPVAVPLGVPFPSPAGVPEPYRKNDTEHGINPEVDTKQVTAPERSKVLTRPQVGKVLTYKMEPGPAPSVEDLEKGDKNELTPHPESAPIKEYFDKASPSPPTETGTAPPGEPTAPPTGGPTIPPIKFPEVATPCNRFPFGIPCWLVARLGEFVTSVKDPKFEPTIDGVKMVIDFKRADQLMEIVRGVELVLGTIAAVLLFGRFASSPTGSSGGSDD